MPDTVYHEIIRLEIEQAEANKAKKEIEAVKKRLVDQRAETARLANEYRKLERALHDGVDVAQEFAQARADAARSRGKEAELEGRYAALLQKTNRAEEESIKLQRQRAREQYERADLYGDVESRTRAITGGIGFVGGEAGAALERNINVGAEVLASVEAVGKLKTELPQMTANLIQSAGGAKQLAIAGGLAAAATVGIVVAWKIAKDIIDRSAEATRNFIEVNQRYAELIATGTTAEVEDAIAANEERNRILELEREKLQEFVNQAKGQGGLAGALVDLNDALNLNLGGYEDVTDRLQEVNQELQGNTNLNEQLTQALRDGRTAAADFAEQMTEVENALRQAASEAINEFKANADQRTQIRQQALSATDPAAVEQQLQALHIQYQESVAYISDLSAAYQNNVLTRQEYRDAVNEALQSQEDLTEQMHLLETVLLPAAQAAQREAEALAAAKQARDEYNRALEQEAAELEKTVEARAKAVEDYASQQADAEVKRQRQLTQDAEDFALKRVRDLAQHYRDLAKEDREYRQKEADLVAKIGDGLDDVEQDRLDEIRAYHKDSERETEDHLDRLNKIERDARKDIRKAARELNAIGIQDAKDQAETELKDEDAQYRKEQRRRDQDYREQVAHLERLARERQVAGQQELDDLRRQHQQEQQDRIAAFSRKRAEEEADHNLSLNRQRAAWAIEDQDRLTHFAEVAGTTQTHFNSLLGIYEDGMADIRQYVRTELAQMVPQRVTTPTAIRPGWQQAPSGKYLPVPEFDTGGDVRGDTLARLHDREHVLPPDVADALRAQGGGRIDYRTLMTGGNTTIHQTNTISVDGAGDPYRAADLVLERIVQLGGG